MLGNTLTLPQAGGDIVLTRIKEGDYSSEYRFRNSTTQYVAKIRHNEIPATSTKPAKNRHNFEVVQTVFQAGDVPEYERKFYFVHEHGPADTSIALADAVADLAIASSQAFLTALSNLES